MKSSNLRIRPILFLFSWLLALGGIPSLQAQILDPVKWVFSAHETDESGSVDVVFHASVEPCWHIYSQFLDDPNGPLPTYFEVNTSEGIEKIGAVTECDPIVEYDPNFMMDLKFFEEEVYWVQRVNVGKSGGGKSFRFFELHGL